MQGGDLRYCQKCCHYKPPRAHHCRVCKRCVLRMVDAMQSLIYLVLFVFFYVSVALSICKLNFCFWYRITIVYGLIIVSDMKIIRCSLFLCFMPWLQASILWYAFPFFIFIFFFFLYFICILLPTFQTFIPSFCLNS